MEPHSDRASRTALACLAVVTAAVALVRLPALWGTLQDDGFIYFRIAENAAHGHGPVFNVGERVDAATSPVWAWLLAIAARCGAPLPRAAPFLGLVAACGAVLLAARWALELAAPKRTAALLLALAGPLLLVADARFEFYAVSGMETTLCALVWLWATRALVRRLLQGVADRSAGWATLAACLVRPEFVLFAAAIAAVALARRTIHARDLARVLAPALVGGGVYLAAHWAYFGDPLPNTYHAKRAADWTHVRIGLAYLRDLPRTYPWLLAGLVALVVPRLRRVAAAVALGLLLYTLHVVGLGGDHFVFHRPYLAVLPMLLALGGAAAAVLWESRSLAARVVTAALAVAALGGAARMRVQPGAFAWVRLSTQLGYALAHAYPPETRVGMFAIGAAGWASHLPVVDALGLADRHVARADAYSHQHACVLDIGHERGDPAYVLDRSDVVVLFGTYAPVPFESLDEVREGFYSQKQFVVAARDAVAHGRFRLRDLAFAPGAHWLVLEKVR